MQSRSIKFAAFLLILLICVILVAGCKSSSSISVSALKVTPEKASVGQEVKIEALVTNSGKNDEKYSATLEINDNKVDTSEIIIGQGQTKSVSFSILRKISVLIEFNWTNCLGN
jgi:23S rRNA A1618 N6-methylase RlmF